MIEGAWRSTARPKSSEFCGRLWRPKSSEIERLLGASQWTARRVLRLYSSVSWLTHMEMWQGDFTSLMVCWLMAVDRVGRHAGSWSYNQRSTRNHENEGKTHNHSCMLYSVYDVLGVCCTRCQLMVMAWWDTEAWLKFVSWVDDRVVDHKERDGGWRCEPCAGYERIWEVRGTTCLIGLGRPRIGVITHRIRTRYSNIGDGTLSRTRNSLTSPLLILIYPTSSQLSPSRPSTLMSSMNTKLSHPPLSMHAMIKS